MASAGCELGNTHLHAWQTRIPGNMLRVSSHVRGLPIYLNLNPVKSRSWALEVCVHGVIVIDCVYALIATYLADPMLETNHTVSPHPSSRCLYALAWHNGLYVHWVLRFCSHSRNVLLTCSAMQRVKVWNVTLYLICLKNCLPALGRYRFCDELECGSYWRGLERLVTVAPVNWVSSFDFVFWNRGVLRLFMSCPLR